MCLWVWSSWIVLDSVSRVESAGISDLIRFITQYSWWSLHLKVTSDNNTSHLRGTRNGKPQQKWSRLMVSEKAIFIPILIMHNTGELLWWCWYTIYNTMEHVHTKVDGSKCHSSCVIPNIEKNRFSSQKSLVHEIFMHLERQALPTTCINRTASIMVDPIRYGLQLFKSITFRNYKF